jgi:hypothetical protein
MKIEKNKLIEDMKKVFEKLNRLPGENDYKRLGTYGRNTITRRFGSWNQALLEIFGEINSLSHKRLEEKQCQNPQCNCMFKPKTSKQKYCSQGCSAKINNLKPKRKRKIRICKSCGENESGRNHYCLNCLAQFKERLLNAPLSKYLQRKNDPNRFAEIRSHAKYVMKSEPKVCKNCGYSKHVEVCHIKDISKFSPETLVKEINHKNNLTLLCPNCHWEFDHMKNGRAGGSRTPTSSVYKTDAVTDLATAP